MIERVRRNDLTDEEPAELTAALDEVDGAADAWAEVDVDTRMMYVRYVAQPWLAGMREARAEDTAAWAVAGTLDEHVQRLTWGGAVRSLFGMLVEPF